MSKSINRGLWPATGRRSCFKPGSSSFKALLVTLAACGSLSAMPACADEYHYNNILIGDRAAGMGGAYTAISDDPSGLYYNPAGIAYAQGSNISVSANALHQAQTVYKNALGNGNDYVRNSFALLPNFFGIIQPLGRGKVGFSYAVPDSILEDQNQAFYNLPGTTTSRYAINFNNNDNTYYFGPSYAIELTDGFSAGLTLYAHYRKNEWISNQLINKTSGTYEWSNMFYKHTEWGMKPILGLMWTPTSKVAAGLSLSQLNILSSSTRDQRVCASDIPDNPSTPWADQGCAWVKPDYQTGTAPVTLTDLKDYKKAYPLTSTIGIAYFPSRALIVSGDFSYYSRTKDIFFDKKPAWNIAFGTEYYLNEKWAIKAGIFTDRSNTPNVVSGNGVSDLDHVDLYGGSMSASYFTRQSSITVGSTFRYGAGRAEITGNDVAQNLNMQSLTLFLSASYFQ